MVHDAIHIIGERWKNRIKKKKEKNEATKKGKRKSTIELLLSARSVKWMSVFSVWLWHKIIRKWLYYKFWNVFVASNLTFNVKKDYRLNEGWKERQIG